MKKVLMIVSLLTIAINSYAEVFVCTAGDVGCLVSSIAKSNANGPSNDYVYLKAGVYTLDRPDNVLSDGANGLPVITGELIIVGENQNNTVIQRDMNSSQFRLFQVAEKGNLRLFYITLQFGEVDFEHFQRGGCISNTGNLEVYFSTIRECNAWIGGGIDNRSTQTIWYSSIMENFADFVGGGLTAIGKTTIESSWIGLNAAQGEAGMAIDPKAPITVYRSTIDGNVAFLSNGGGIGGLGNIEIQKSTIIENYSSLRGGGIELSDGKMFIRSTYLWGNEAEIEGGGAFISGGAASLFDSIVVYNKAGRLGVTTGIGGGIAIRPNSRVSTERSYIIHNEADVGSECSGHLIMRQWNVIDDPTITRNSQIACK